MKRIAGLLLVVVMLLPVAFQPVAAVATSDAVNTVMESPASFDSMASAYSGKWIDINLSRQRLTAYVGGKAVYSSLISSGTSAHPTPSGRYTILDHVRSQTMSGPGYYLTGVPYVMHFRAGGYAIHGTYWHHNFGHPMSHGCINLPTSAAGWLYSWARNGTTVSIHY